MASPSSEPTRLWPRALAFVAIAGWMVWGPVWTQLLGRSSYAAFEWRMFSRLGRDTCSVRYVQRADDGSEEPLDRFALLGHPDRASAPPELQRSLHLKDAIALGPKLCKALGGAPDVRLYARCGTSDGWRDAAAGESNLCVKRPRREEAP